LYGYISGKAAECPVSPGLQQVEGNQEGTFVPSFIKTGKR
jgi:hypothetical protein